MEYHVLAAKHSQMPNGAKDLIFRIPLTETQVTEEAFDYNLSFLDPFVEQQLGQGAAPYNPAKSQLLSGDNDTVVGGLNYTPYQ